MKIFDLTHTINSSMPVYPGTEQPIITDGTTIENDGFAEKRITMFSHTGTHIDSPGHMLADKPTLDNFGIGKYYGRGFVVNVQGNDDGNIDEDFLQQYSGEIRESDYVLFHTGWDKKWGTPEYFIDFPVLTAEAVKYLCSFDLKGIGFDCISVDKVGDNAMNNHITILNENMIIVENLCNLSSIVGIHLIFSCFPLKIEQADGSPVRAVGMLE